MENSTKVVSKRLTIILTTNLCEYLHDESRFREFLFCLDILVSGDSDSSISNSAQLMASGIPLHLLGYLPQSNLSVEMQDLLGNIISSMCLHLAKMILPSLQINKRMLTLGMSKISCVKLTSLQPVLDRLSSREEITAVLTLLYFSYLHQYRYWDNAQLLNFLTQILRRHPDIFSYESVVIRALVYLLSSCQLSVPLVTDCYSGDIEKFVLLQLEKTPIDVWFTDCLIVYKWCLLTQERTATLGTKLVEYWLTQIDITHCSDSHMLDSLSENNKMLLDDMKFHFQFLMSLLNHLSSESISSKARNVFVYCISKLTRDDMSLVNAVHKLFIYATRSFETSYLQNTTANVAENFLCVMNVLLNCQLSSTIDRIICVKSVYLVLKLITKDGQTLSTVTNGLQFLSSVTQGLTFQDSKTVIPPILQNERFLTILEKCVTQQDATISQPSLVLVSWLAFHDDGIQIQRSVRISSDYLLRGLAMCKADLCVPLIKLIDVALSKKQGAMTFYKCQPNYKSTQIFSFRELKQIYLYLQQFILQENLDVRCSVVNCIEKLLAAGPEINEYILYQAWNIQMLESVLASRKLLGLTEAELTLCCLFSSKVNIWSSIALDSFLMALINTDLLQDHGHKAVMFMQKIKKSINFDKELLQLAELHLNEVTIQNR
ncbi:uncharacterized protein LOC131927616 isoform X1 [Physella acuta]|uniref:uncharacterized protein LOC131927616 isoform X1 n=1 Tax=Physella acuta TaxID=109671 RepID=UPI0027DDC050|nr:uncharacterized protein LOC131927616 isoform X1 [Physella acuta]